MKEHNRDKFKISLFVLGFAFCCFIIFMQDFNNHRIILKKDLNKNIFEKSSELIYNEKESLKFHRPVFYIIKDGRRVKAMLYTIKEIREKRWGNRELAKKKN